MRHNSKLQSTDRQVPGWLAYAGMMAISLALSGCDSRLISSATPVPTKPLPDSSQLQTRIDAIVDHTLNQRRLNTRDHAAWQIVHAILAFGPDLLIEHEGQLVPALGYLQAGNPLTGWNLRPTAHGVLVPVEEGSKTGQGHPDQWLGYLSQTGLTPADKIVIGKKSYTIADLRNQAQWDLVPGMEATWTLMALSHPSYWKLTDTWKNRNGETWNIEKLALMEAQAPVVGGSCGGTHRLYALAVALNQYRNENQIQDVNKLPPAWAVVHARIQEFVTQAQREQNADGTFSTNYFTRPGNAPRIDDKISTTGHILEFLTAALTDQELAEPWVTRSCERLVTLMEIAKNDPVECGGLYHAAHGLIIYRARRWGN
ncbi:MAG: ADP-ribosylation factor-directed GTPase activating protein isoform b [Pirellulales bacterium]|nr:ADP-ribosylation factor-directed GTPase activating protein isoform b [Pirellulales bacterium]